jgi:voltage-gated potassium channel Kch
VPRYLGALRTAHPVPAEAGPTVREREGHVILCGYGRVGSAVARTGRRATGVRGARVLTACSTGSPPAGCRANPLRAALDPTARAEIRLGPAPG